MCGGTGCRKNATLRQQGLSPRVRGNLRLPPRQCRPSGSIPACAGEPSHCWYCSTHCRVYPRVCGGTCKVAFRLVNATGLSPRVRGNLGNQFRRHSTNWSIPACAGEPSAAGRPSGECRVYPRVCGGTKYIRQRQHLSAGLSPRVRGNPLPFGYSLGEVGSIPACAGEPVDTCNNSLHFRVYPRVCGGTPSGRPYVARTEGLSPRVRGNQCPPAGD